MESIIIYGSRYGSARRYAEKLSEQTGISAVSYKEAPDLADVRTVIYLGGLYAGGVLGLAKTMRGFLFREEKKLLIATVGLADPEEAENRDNIRRSIQRQISKEQFDNAVIFHLRGKIDYQNLSFSHRTMMKLLYHSLRGTPIERQTPENRALIETYGKQVDFTDFKALEPIICELQGNLSERRN